MANFNKAILSGNIGSDPKVAEDGSWTHASIATSNSWKDKKTDEWQEKVQWHRIMAYGYVSEKLAKCKKGQNIMVEGSIDYFEPKEEGQNPSAYIKAEKIITSPVSKSQESNGAKDDIPFG